MDKPNSKPLKMGIMCKGSIFRYFQAQCVKELLETANVKIEVLIVNGAKENNFLLHRIKRIQLKHLLFNIYLKLFFKPKANKPVNLETLLQHVPRLICRTEKKGKHSEYFNAVDLKKIKEYDLDFILRFDFGIIRGEILNAARYGVWSFHSGDEQKYRGTPPYFWEIYNDEKICGAILQKLTERLDGGVILKKGFVKNMDYSYNKTYDSIYFEMARWPAQVCADIHNGTADYLFHPPSSTKARVYYTPDNLQTAVFIFKLFKNYFLNIYKRLFVFEKWGIGIIEAPIYSLLNQQVQNIRFLDYRNKKKFIADPFGIVNGEKINILCEEYDYKSFLGKIINIKLNNDFTIAGKEEALKSGCHLSYPFLFEKSGELYCVPESAQANELNLYRVEKSTYKLIKVSTIVKGAEIIDPSIVYYNNYWWLFYSERQKGSFHNLFIKYAENPEGPWKPHALNPAKTDIASARSAGTPFIYNNILYRPAQDCSDEYGKNVVINKITKINPKEFMEEKAAVIKPDKNSIFPDGIHTISKLGDNYTLIDSKRNEFIMSAFIFIIKRKFFKLLRV